MCRNTLWLLLDVAVHGVMKQACLRGSIKKFTSSVTSLKYYILGEGFILFKI